MGSDTDYISQMPPELIDNILLFLCVANDMRSLESLRGMSNYFQKSVEKQRYSGKSWSEITDLDGKISSLDKLDGVELGLAIARITQGGLEHLNEEQRRSVVAKALQLEDEACSSAIAGIVQGGLEHLNKEQRGAVVAKALVLAQKRAVSEKARAAVIETIARNDLQNLDDDQREALTDSVNNITADDECYSIAIAGIAQGGLQHLSVEQREDIVNGAIGIQDEDPLSRAIAGIAKGGLQHLSVEQREKIVDYAFGIEQDLLFHRAILGIVQGGLEHCDNDQRKQIVDAALGFEDNTLRSSTISQIGQGLEFLDNDQRERIVDATLNLLGYNRALAVHGISQGLQHLSFKQREQIVDAALELTREENGFYAISPIILQGGLEHLSPKQCRAIVAAADRFNGNLQVLRHQEMEQNLLKMKEDPSINTTKALGKMFSIEQLRKNESLPFKTEKAWKSEREHELGEQLGPDGLGTQWANFIDSQLSPKRKIEEIDNRLAGENSWAPSVPEPLLRLVRWRLEPQAQCGGLGGR